MSNRLLMSSLKPAFKNSPIKPQWWVVGYVFNHLIGSGRVQVESKPDSTQFMNTLN